MSRLKIIFLLLIVPFMSVTKLSAQISQKKVRYNYLTYLPANYDSLKNQELPVIFYLHGRSVSGTDISRIRTYGLPYFLDKGKKLNYIVIAPQCPWGKNWASENWLDTIYSEISSKYKIDSTRIYLTGMSLGGFGTWELANRYPHRFAAIAPLCGGGKTEWAENLSQIPIWVFHGAKDRQVSVYRSDQMVNALEKYQACVKYSRFPEMGHDLHRIYNKDELYDWFAQFTLRPTGQEEENKMKLLTGIKLDKLQNQANKEPLQRIIHEERGGTF